MNRWIVFTWAFFLSTKLLAADTVSFVSAANLPVKATADAKSEVVETLPKGALVKVLEHKETWTLVQTPTAKVGWVEAASLTQAPEIAPETAIEQIKEESQKEPEEMLSGNSDQGGDFREITLAIRPGLSRATDHPSTMDNKAFSIGGHVSFFLLPRLALHFPYTYTRWSSKNAEHEIGGGPLLRFLDWKFLRGDIDVNGLYAHLLGGDHFGWSGGIDLTAGLPHWDFRPFFGPFFRYETVYLPGQNLKSYSYGIGIKLTNLVDFQ